MTGQIARRITFGGQLWLASLFYLGVGSLLLAITPGPPSAVAGFPGGSCENSVKGVVAFDIMRCAGVDSMCSSFCVTTPNGALAPAMTGLYPTFAGVDVLTPDDHGPKAVPWQSIHCYDERYCIPDTFNYRECGPTQLCSVLALASCHKYTQGALKDTNWVTSWKLCD